MIEERYYTYNQIGNLLSFRHRYPSAGSGRGVFAVGGSGSADGKASRGSFNGLSSSGMSSGAQGDYSGNALMPYVYGFGGDAPDGGYNGRGSLASGANGAGISYQGAGSFNPMTPAYAGAASEGSGYDGRGVLAFTRGIPAYAGIGGFGGWEGQEYTGPYGETTIDYTYGDVNGEYPHAVTARSNGDTFTYDAIGNMTSRTQGGITWTQVFDAENRLVSVGDGTSATTYVYDGGGGRLKRIVSAGGVVTTTLYVSGLEIEAVDASETKRTIYYPSGGAFRVVGGENAGLYFRHSDHLGSTSVLSNASGLKVAGSDVVYAPFGEVRSGEQSALTDFGYTGQRKDDSTGGLMYYGARYYLPGIQHFISADTIVPGSANPQAFNRYSYVLNNPVMLTDPSGHMPGGLCYLYPEICSGKQKTIKPAQKPTNNPSKNGYDDPRPTSIPQYTGGGQFTPFAYSPPQPNVEDQMRPVDLPTSTAPGGGEPILYGPPRPTYGPPAPPKCPYGRGKGGCYEFGDEIGLCVARPGYCDPFPNGRKGVPPDYWRVQFGGGVFWPLSVSLGYMEDRFGGKYGNVSISVGKALTPIEFSAVAGNMKSLGGEGGNRASTQQEVRNHLIGESAASGIDVGLIFGGGVNFTVQNMNNNMRDDLSAVGGFYLPTTGIRESRVAERWARQVPTEAKRK